MFNLYDVNNIKNCEDCFYNIGANFPETVLPCGQFNCWVELHCRIEDDEDEYSNEDCDDYYEE